MTPRRHSTSKLEHLVDLVYATVDDARQWDVFLTALVEALDSRGAVLLQHDLVAHGVTQAVVRVDPDAPRQYDAYYHRFDARAISPVARHAAVGRVIVDQEFVPYDDVRRTAFHNEWSLKFDVSRLVAITLDRGPNAAAFLSVLRADRDEPFGAREVAPLNVLAPHARRALRLQRLLRAAEQRAQTLLDGLDGLTIAVLLLDKDMRIVHANAAAREILADRDGLTDDGGTLRAMLADDTRALRQVCAACASDPTEEPLSLTDRLAIARPSGREALSVGVCRLRHESRLRDDASAATTMVVISDPCRIPATKQAVLQSLFALTPAEATVAVRLATGAGAREIADELGYTAETARWYVKQVLGKASCRSRAEFVHKVSLRQPMLPDHLTKGAETHLKKR